MQMITGAVISAILLLYNVYLVFCLEGGEVRFGAPLSPAALALRLRPCTLMKHRPKPHIRRKPRYGAPSCSSRLGFFQKKKVIGNSRPIYWHIHRMDNGAIIFSFVTSSMALMEPLSFPAAQSRLNKPERT